MRTQKTILTLLFISLAIALGITIAYVVLEAATDILDTNKVYAITFAIATPISYIWLALVFSNFVSFRQVIRKLKLENTYYLGKPTEFYNYYLFSKRAKWLNFFTNKNKEAWMIASTSMKLTIMRNSTKNESITSYLGLIADEIEDKLRIHNKGLYKSLTYCYYHGLFVIYCFGNIEQMEEIAHMLEESMYSIAEQNKLNVYVQPYFGFAKSSRNNDELLIDLEKASLARSEAEKLYKSFEYFTPQMDKHTTQNEIDELREALVKKEFVVFYQPKFNLMKNSFTSSEALVRWKSNKHGLVSPAKFIEIAETCGLIHDVDMFVYKQVCEDISDNKKRGKKVLPVSVNFSVQEFYDDSFVDSLEEIANQYKVSKDLLQVEITERTSQINSFMTINIVKKLKERGFKVLMDDFGVGYSNLQNLMSIPFDALKLDRSYIINIANDKKAYELTKMIVNLCRSNDITFIAEGVDSEAQVEILRRLKCDVIQGFYYAKPMPKRDFDAFVAPGGNKFEIKKTKGEN